MKFGGQIPSASSGQALRLRLRMTKWRGDSDDSYYLFLFLKAEATAGALFRFTFTFALLFDSKPPRQCLIRYKLPRAIHMDAQFPIGFAKTVIVAFEVVMVRKTNDNIDAATRIVNELYALVFVAISVRGSVRRRSMSVPAARTQTNRKALARDKHKRCTSQNNR